MKSKTFISYTISHNLCTGCGVCEDVCPTFSLSMKLKNGLFVPQIDESTCINSKGCNKCFQVCSGSEINIQRRAEILFNIKGLKKDKYIGIYTSLFSGYSLDQEIRYHSASGGLLSQFLIYLLEKKIIAGAIVTAFDENLKSVPKPFIATNREAVLSARSSKYCPVSLNEIGNEVRKREGRFIIVGLPCHIQSFRKRESIDGKFKDKILGYFSIYCSSNRSFYATEYLFKRYRIDPSKLTYFAYRDEGCLGSMKIVYKDKTTKTIPYIEYYPRLRSYFKPRRCLSCIDHYGALADVCFGDIHVGEYKKDKIGVNSLIIRNPIFESLFHLAKDENYISISKISPFIVNESQKEMLYSKKKKVYTLLFMDKLFGRKTVLYDVELKEKLSIKSIIGYFITDFQRYIGNHKSLWPLISLIGQKH